MRSIVAEILLLAIVLVGGAVLYNYFTSQSTVAAGAKFYVAVTVTTTSDGKQFLDIAIKNIGTGPATITSVKIDNAIDITGSLGIGKNGLTLKPGKELRKVIQLNQQLSGGVHKLIITYKEAGQTKQASADFTA